MYVVKRKIRSEKC